MQIVRATLAIALSVFFVLCAIMAAVAALHFEGHGQLNLALEFFACQMIFLCAPFVINRAFYPVR